MHMTESFEHDRELNPSEREALSALPREMSPPPELEERTLAALRSRGLVQSDIRSPNHSQRWIATNRLIWLAAGLAASLVSFLVGIQAGRSNVDRGLSAATPQFLLLLYEDEAFPADSSEATDLVEEYRRWALGLRRDGRLLSAEKLSSSGILIESSTDITEVLDRVPDSPEGVVAGYFVIAAHSYEDAVEVARTSPHLRHGGSVSVRAIDPT